MKNTMKRILSGVLVVAIISACLCLTAGAELKLDSRSISIHSGIRISVDGKEFIPVDSDGAAVEVFLYNGTTYLPVRGISNLFGLGIEWDNESKSVYLGTRGGKELPKYSGTASVETTPFAVEAKTVTVHTGASIYFNDKHFVPTGSDGETVEVFLYNGTTYLPVRAISTLMNAEIDWDQNNKTVLLSTAEKEPELDVEGIVKAAEAAAKKYTDMEGLVLPYYRYYLKICTVLDGGLEEVKAMYLSDPNEITLYMLNSYVAGYEAFDKEFGTYMSKTVEYYEFAKTLTNRIKSYAEGGYTAEELDKLATNASYLNDHLKYFSEYLDQGSPELMLKYFIDNAAVFGDTNVVLAIGEIEFKY